MILAAVKRWLGSLGRLAVERGLPPSWLGWRWVRHEPVREHLRHAVPGGSYEVLHEPSRAEHPFPRNVGDRQALPDVRGWWGFSFRDVPERRSGETFLATVPDCRIVSYRDPAQQDDFHPAVLTREGHALTMREVRFRPPHADVLRRPEAPVHLEKATWILERVYHNHSHWLTAHLPKVILLARREGLDDLVLPAARTPVMDASLRMLGLDPDSFATVDTGRLLHVDRLTLLGTDRFRPELLRLVQDAYGPTDGPAPHRRIYISRSRAARRRLVDEDQLWTILEDAGFERIWMEDLAFEEQVRLMQQTSVVVAPHGAGLTNMMFCPPGTHVVEIADLSFPNPNFYALASGLGHHYWLLEAGPAGEGHPLERDMRVEADRLARLVDELDAST